MAAAVALTARRCSSCDDYTLCPGRSAKIGPGQLGLAAGALTIALIIVVVSGADYTGASKRFKGVRAKSPPPDGIEAKLLASRAATLTAKLEETPGEDMGGMRSANSAGTVKACSSMWPVQCKVS